MISFSKPRALCGKTEFCPSSCREQALSHTTQPRGCSGWEGGVQQRLSLRGGFSLGEKSGETPGLVGGCSMARCDASIANPACSPLSPPAPRRHPNHCPGLPLRQGFHPRLPVCLAKAGQRCGPCAGPQVPLSLPAPAGKGPAAPQHLWVPAVCNPQ